MPRNLGEGDMEIDRIIEFEGSRKRILKGRANVQGCIFFGGGSK